MSEGSVRWAAQKHDQKYKTKSGVAEATIDDTDGTANGILYASVTINVLATCPRPLHAKSMAVRFLDFGNNNNWPVLFEDTMAHRRRRPCHWRT